MRFRDLFVPRWQHSNPEVRKKAVSRLRDTSLLRQISEMDDHQMVRDAALAQLETLTEQQVRVTESE
jgi:exonuclease SbcC